MRIIIRPRLAGKTFEIIKYASEKNRLILCFSRIEADRVWNEMILMHEDGKISNLPPRPMSMTEFLDGRARGKHYDGVLIDNADVVLQMLVSPQKLEAISLNTDKMR